MFVKYLKLCRFRNTFDLELHPNPRFNLLVGKNAQGKTNIIESIYLFSSGTSFRSSEFRDMIGIDCETASADMVIARSSGDDKLKFSMTRTKKEFIRNSKNSRFSSKTGLYAVIFAPEEILLLRGSPAGRRKYIDTLINQVSPAHSSLVKKYTKVIAQRNKLLQMVSLSRCEIKKIIPSWNSQLIQLGARLTFERSKWIARLNKLIPVKYSAMASGDGEARFHYQPNCGIENIGQDISIIEGRMEEMLSQREDDEFARCLTLVGPHRDDLVAMMGDRPVREYGSQGQHRTFMLAVKMSEVDFIKNETGELPVLLLDDVASELDESRNAFLFNYLRHLDVQVFITSTSRKDIRLPDAEDVNVFYVESGRVSDGKCSNSNVCAV
ncbi:MAG: DNA replication and repair protein RecF [bacterium ADurb.Bin270]|nr:DNA replication/repair protein RecF [Myxococcales bacterium]OQA62167.1 MAG: DNA replication and repair protein RecF [bacterium ADurb.Bin270]HQG13235.1 DNA replication/repair protein RecF [bacterium]HQH80411.1 DNA replication/repair protein RecF [bacterium]